MDRYTKTEDAFTVWTAADGKEKAVKVGEFRRQVDAVGQAERWVGHKRFDKLEVYAPKNRGENLVTTITVDE